jgi:catechol 2,3-dioxygenase-like lactoylglutathione lyase family enzyme
MTDTTVTADGIDHVELVVPDPAEAAGWYGDALGLTPVEGFDDWAEGAGPLLISSDGGATNLALFEGEPRTGEPTGFTRVAFRVDGSGFLRFVDGFDDLPGVESAGRADVVDHDLSVSVYFTDPYGHRLEVTTYEHEYVVERL